MYPAKQSTALDIVFFAFDSNGDGVTGKVDGDWTKRISKNGAAFGAMTVTVTERENGFYHAQLSTSHTDTLGVLTCSFSASGVKRVNLQFRVHARVPDDLAYPTTSGRSMDVDASGGVEVGSFQAGALTSAAFATDAITSTVLAASAITEIQTGLSTLDAAGVRAAVGLASANLDTQLTAIDDFLDTEIAAIKAKTDNLPADPADASDIAASFTTVNSKLDTIDDFLDTEVAAIKTKTDQLVFTNANKVDAAIVAAGDFAQAAADKAWSTAARTLTAFGFSVTVGTLAADAITAASIATDAGQEIADAVLGRSVSTVQASAAEHSLCTMILAGLESSISGTTWTIKRTDGSTTHFTKTITTNAAAEPIVSVA